ncbi:DUF6113 family protein [Actinomadura latina]|uniref:Integral membrane protein n=1 Tax=Actinomadura latina TaxID=163603 RepID=A0A846YYP0_9ACTN|nr:DUF6113 family protein [Actinomadura latina]NKZ03902.1 hypothetical protein [Actinomadura latina]
MHKDDDEARVSLAKDGLPADGAATGVSRAGEGPLEAFVSGAAYAALALLGGVFGVVGSFAQDWTIGPVPVIAIVLVALVFAMARLAGLGMGGRLGATVPAVVWGVVVFVMSMRRAEGDLVVAGTTAGYLFIIGGMLAAVAGIMSVPPARPPGDWLLGRAGRTRG